MGPHVNAPQGPGAPPEVDLRPAWAKVRQAWMDRFDAPSAALARKLGRPHQVLSQWASGTDPSKRPPLDAIVATAADLGLEFRVSDKGWSFARRGKA